MMTRNAQKFTNILSLKMSQKIPFSNPKSILANNIRNNYSFLKL